MVGGSLGLDTASSRPLLLQASGGGLEGGRSGRDFTLSLKSGWEAAKPQERSEVE